MKIAICDDELKHLNSLENALLSISGGKIECDAFLSGKELLATYEKNPKSYDVIFLDMEMDKLNGIETANIIREKDEYVIIVFVTSHTEYMRESFKCLPFRFLVKPVDLAELTEVYNDISKKISKTNKVLTVTEGKAIHRIFSKDIIYCESSNHFVYIHTKDRIYKVCKSLANFYEQCDKEMIYRVHTSFLVNFHYVKSIRNNFIEMYHSPNEIPISRTYKKSVLAEYTNFVERNLYV